MYILGIETSCDETAAAVLTEEFQVLSSIVLSQDEIHAPFGGVVPELASRQHLSSISYVIQECLNRGRLTLEQVDVYAVTQGPGLIGSLLIGLSFAKALAYYFKKPLVPVDHIEAHTQSAFLEAQDIPFPVLGLVVSGGHTSTLLMKKKLQYKIIGKTRDDAAGEALDKIAKFLGLGYPGGPIIDTLAEKGNPDAFSFSLPRMTDRSLDFSFSGLKTEAIKKVRALNISKSHPSLSDFLASFEQAIIRALLSNLEQGIRIFKPKSLILCGGVARNKKLREKFKAFSSSHRLHSFMPSPELCTDNAVMVASLAVEKLTSHREASFPLTLNAYPR